MRLNSGPSAIAAMPKPAAPGILGILERLAAMLRGATGQQSRTLRCVEALQLGPKRTLYLVECDGQRFLAGGGSEGIHTLQPIAQPVRPSSPAGEFAS